MCRLEAKVTGHRSLTLRHSATSLQLLDLIICCHSDGRDGCHCTSGRQSTPSYSFAISDDVRDYPWAAFESGFGLL